MVNTRCPKTCVSSISEDEDPLINVGPGADLARKTKMKSREGSKNCSTPLIPSLAFGLDPLGRLTREDIFRLN